MRKYIILFAFGAFILILLTLLIVFGGKGNSSSVTQSMRPITLNYWRVWDGSNAFASIIERYQQLHPYVTIKYKLLKYDEYEQKLLEAFASDREPDIFSVHNTWTRKYQSRGWITPMPAKTTMVYPVEKGSIKKEIVNELRSKPSHDLNYIKEYYVDTVYDDIVMKGKNPKTKKKEIGVYGFPMAVDTLIMFVNRDLFNNAGITNIPKYWDKEFQQTVRKLTKQDNKGQIIQAGVALGGGYNVERSSDILSVLMMQNGTEMMNLNNTQITMDQAPQDGSTTLKSPGQDAIRFYTDFANPAKEVYSWNNTMENSLDLFIRGKVAIMFGYSYMLPQIEDGNPKMNLVVSKLPQIEGNVPVNFANYWVEVVASKGEHTNEAWDFVLFATEAEQAASYLKATKKLTAIRSMVDAQKQDLEIGPYAEQVLTAKSWYKGNDSNSAEDIMKATIEQISEGSMGANEALGVMSSKVQQTINVSF